MISFSLCSICACGGGGSVEEGGLRVDGGVLSWGACWHWGEGEVWGWVWGGVLRVEVHVGRWKDSLWRRQLSIARLQNCLWSSPRTRGGCFANAKLYIYVWALWCNVNLCCITIVPQRWSSCTLYISSIHHLWSSTRTRGGCFAMRSCMWICEHVWTYVSSIIIIELHREQEGGWFANAKLLCELCGVMLTYIASQLCHKGDPHVNIIDSSCLVFTENKRGCFANALPALCEHFFLVFHVFQVNMCFIFLGQWSPWPPQILTTSIWQNIQKCIYGYIQTLSPTPKTLALIFIKIKRGYFASFVV